MSADALNLEPVRPLLRVEYDRLVEAGVFEDEKLELIEGRLVPMSPEGPRHAAVISRLVRLLIRALDEDRGTVRAGNPLAASDTSEPEPDVAVVAPDSYSDAHHPASALLAVEVAHSSLRKDRMVKPGLYAGASVPEYWIVDLDADKVWVLREPVNGGYGSIVEYVPGQAIVLVAFPDVSIEVAEFLYPPGR